MSDEKVAATPHLSAWCARPCRIGPRHYRWEILTEEQCEDMRLVGQHNFLKGTLRIQEGLDVECAALVLMHEFGHAIIKCWLPDRDDEGSASEEDFVDAFSKGWVAFMQDNPELVIDMVERLRR